MKQYNMIIDTYIKSSDLKKSLDNFWKLTGNKAITLDQVYDTSQGAPVFNVNGIYTTRGWTEWTQGFQYIIPLLITEATGNKDMLNFGKEKTIAKMVHYLCHFGVHVHRFNNLSTYENYSK